MAYPYVQQTYTDSPVSPNEWTLNGGATDNTDAVSSAGDTKYVSSTTNSDEFWLYPYNNWDRDLENYEYVVVEFRARTTATGYGQVAFQAWKGFDIYSVDLTSSFADYRIGIPISQNFWTFINSRGTLNISTNSGSNLKVTSRISGTGAVEISEIRYYIVSAASEYGVLLANGDGSNSDFTKSTGTAAWSLVDDWTGLAFDDWAGNDDTSDYITSTTDGDIQDFDLETPSAFEPAQDDFVCITFCAVNPASTSNFFDPLKIDLIESGTSFTTQMLGQYALGTTYENMAFDDSGRDPRFATMILRLDSTPSNWANVQLRIVSQGITASYEAKIYQFALIAPFAYSPPVTAAAADSINFADAGTAAWNMGAADAANLSDSGAAVQTYVRGAADALNVSDAATNLAAFLAASVDNFQMQDVAAALQSHIANASDAVDIADAGAALVTVYVAAADGLHLSDAATNLVQYLAGTSDSISIADAAIGLAAYIMAASDALTLSDVAAGLATYIMAAADAANLADSADGLTAYNVAGADGLHLADVAAALVVVLAAAVDNFDLSDVSAGVAAYIGAGTDSMNLADAAAALVSYTGASSDGLTVADVAGALAAYAVSAADRADLADVAAGLRVFTAAAADVMAMQDRARYPITGVSYKATLSLRPSLAAKITVRPSLDADVTLKPSLAAKITLNSAQ